MVADLCHFVLSCFRGEKAPCENPPNGDLFVLSHGDLSPRNTKVRDIPCVAFSATVCRIFDWRGERSPCKKPTTITICVSICLSRFRPENTFIRHGTNLWWLIYAMSYKRVFGAKTRKVATRKPDKRWFCRVFAWRPFVSPCKDRTNRRRKGDAWKVSYFRVAGRKVAMRKHEKVTIWRVFAWRLFVFSPRKHDNTWHKSATIPFVSKLIIFYSQNADLQIPFTITRILK